MPPIPKNNNMTTTTMPCSICCEDNKPNLIALTKCSHVSCSDCLVQWIERVESTGQMSLPGCPFCRLPLTEEETHAILGRPFSPATANGGTDGDGSSGNGTEEMDDLTRQLLQSLNVRPCPRCGAWIEKLQGGCDMMECLCGYRFCYGCGAAGARCGCTPDTHSFWDNVLDRNAGRTVATEAALDEHTGVVDLAKHIAKRKQKDKEDQIRRQRADRRQRTAYEIRTADPLVYYSAKWLFCGSNNRNGKKNKGNNNSNASALRMLHQLLQKPKIQMERQTLQRQSARDLRDVDELVMSARWLFTPSRRGAFELLEQLKRRSTYYTRCRRQTLRQSEQQTMDALTYSAKWLFLPESSAFRMLSQQRQAERTRQERDRKRQRAAAVQYGHGSTTTTAHHHLSGTNMIVLKEGEFPEAMIASGSWLYRKKTREATIGHMKRLFLHQTKAARARFNRRFNSFPGFGGYVGIGIGIGGGGCDNPACNECCWDHRGANCSASAFGERENAMVLRLMFLRTEEEVMEEKQLIAKYGL